MRNTGRTHFKKGHIPWNKNKGDYMLGGKNHQWKGGVTTSKEHINKVRKLWRHRIGISEKCSGNPIHKKYYNKRYKYRFVKEGKLLIKDVQFVYEDNIKKYGTLTCVYCLNPVEFGNDSLDHIIPLSRDGTNKKENLTIACCKCNCSKGTKLLTEWRKK